MEISKQDKLLSLIFPVLTVLYGVTVIISGMYNPMMQNIMGSVIIAAGVVTAVLILLLKINTTECLKVQTISAVVTYWLHLVTKRDFVPTEQAVILDIYFTIFYIAVDLGSIVIMMFKLPYNISVRQRLAVFFANPVLYSLLNRLMNIFSDFLDDLELI